MNIKILPSDWDEKNFRPDDITKVSLFKTDINNNGYIMGKSLCGCYSMTVNPGDMDFPDRIKDFIQYENEHYRCVLIYSPDFNVENILAHHTPIIGLRKTDLPFATHSTTLAAYEKIVRDGFLKSTSRLRKDGITQKAVGFMPLGEPDDYLDYVMFAPVDGWGCGNEMVVNSQLRGEACFDPNAPYTPQARMYFDAYKIISDGLAVRDGVHYLKVYDSMPLNEYFILTVFEKDVALPIGQTYWTPTNFTEQANEFFARFVERRKKLKQETQNG